MDVSIFPSVIVVAALFENKLANVVTLLVLKFDISIDDALLFSNALDKTFIGLLSIYVQSFPLNDSVLVLSANCTPLLSIVALVAQDPAVVVLGRYLYLYAMCG